MCNASGAPPLGGISQNHPCTSGESTAVFIVAFIQNRGRRPEAFKRLSEMPAAQD